MTFIEFITSIIAGSTAIAAVVIWLGKLVITKSFDAGIERYKAELTKGIEKHKAELIKVNAEHQVRFSKLHEERGAKIRYLYNAVIELEQALIYSTTVSQGPGYNYR